MVRLHRIIEVFLVLPVEAREVEEIPCFCILRLPFQAHIRQVTTGVKVAREHTFEGWWTSGDTARHQESLAYLSITIKLYSPLPFASHEYPPVTGFWRRCYSWRGKSQWDHADASFAPSLRTSHDSTSTRGSKSLGRHCDRTLRLIL